MQSFLDLIKVTTKEDFFNNFYGSKLLHSHPGVEAVLSLMSWQGFNELLDITTVHNGQQIGLSKNGKTEFNPEEIWLVNGDRHAAIFGFVLVESRV